MTLVMSTNVHTLIQVFPEKMATRRFISHRTIRTAGLKRGESTERRIVLPGTRVAFLQAQGLVAGLEEHIRPSVTGANDLKVTTTLSRVLGARGVPIGRCQQQLAERAHVAKEQGGAMSLRWVGGARRVSD